MNLLMELKNLEKKASKEIDSAEDLKQLDDIYRVYLGKKGEITRILRSLKDLPQKERKNTGELANKIKNGLELEVAKKKYILQSADWLSGKIQAFFDITVPCQKPLTGHLHPITLNRRKIEEIFQQMGFSVIEGPEIESECYNFDALNIPKDHPARDAWDTLWLKPINQKLLLRTHTSPVQIRYMEKHQPPFKIIVPGRVFRHEATDAAHDAQFYQLEGLMVGKDISVANFKAIMEEFFQRFFNKKIKVRMRPGFFPFTEPSFEMDISCVNCHGQGCSVCKQTGWLETMGAGMVHPNVLKNSGLNPKFWQGFAFGMGLDRLAMLKYKINDIRLFYSSDLRFLEQF